MSPLLDEIFNVGHIFLMGTFSLIVLGLSSEVLGGRLSDRLHHYLAAFLVTIMVGALLEIAQIPGPRDADILDVVRAAAGAFSFLSLYIVYDRRMVEARKKWRRSANFIVLATPLVVLVVALLPMIIWGVAFYHRNSILPSLCTFDSVWETFFWTTRNATLERTLPPRKWREADGTQVGRMTCQPSRRSGFAINQVYSDWTQYSILEIFLYLDQDTPTTFSVQLEDDNYRGTNDDRFTYRTNISPGANAVEVSLELARRLPGGRPLDMGRIKTVYFFTSDTSRTIIVYLDAFGLR